MRIKFIMKSLIKLRPAERCDAITRKSDAVGGAHSSPRLLFEST